MANAPAQVRGPMPSATAEGAAPKVCPKCGGRYPADFRVCPRDAATLEDAPASDDPLVGTTLAESYQIVREIGEGAMGRVYEARHTRLPNKRYAVKILHEELARQPDTVTRFQREAEAASALLHPNVVGVFDVNHTLDGRPYIVAEYLEGEQLGEFLDRAGRLPAPVAAHIVRQVCKALGAAHQRGIVHRDVKPENVFLTGDPSSPIAKVLDFGISKVAGDGAGLTKTGMVMGTPAYMAPEQARGDKVGHQADIYAVGAILYRAATGKRPFEGLDALATLTSVLTEEPPRPRDVDTKIPEALEIVIQRAMAKEPRDRYQTMADLDAELAVFDTGIPAGTIVTDGAGTTMVKPISASASDATARTMLAGAASPTANQTVQRMAREARLARPTIVGVTLLGFVWFGALLIEAIASAIRWLGQGNNLTSTESALTLLGAGAGMLTPTILWMRYITRGIWKSTPRAIELSIRLRRTVFGAAAFYGMAALGITILEIVVRREASGVAWPGWQLVEFAVALTAAALGWFSSLFGRRP